MLADLFNLGIQAVPSAPKLSSASIYMLISYPQIPMGLPTCPHFLIEKRMAFNNGHKMSYSLSWAFIWRSLSRSQVSPFPELKMSLRVHRSHLLRYLSGQVDPVFFFSTMSSFKISIPTSDISTLKSRLESTIFPDEVQDAGSDYGAPLADIKRLVARWREGYDWKKEEARLNAELPQFTQDIEVEGFDVLNIHYVYKKSERKGAIPFLFVHGCEWCYSQWLTFCNSSPPSIGPGSFLEVIKIIHILTQVSEDLPTFDVVALSLPGFGFSEGVKKKGFAIPQYAEVSDSIFDDQLAQYIAALAQTDAFPWIQRVWWIIVTFIRKTL